MLSCGNGKSGNIDEPYDGGYGVCFDTPTINQIDSIEDVIPVAKEVVPNTPGAYSSSSTSERQYDICVDSILPLRMIWKITA